MASISIIIPTMNRRELLSTALDSLSNQTRPCTETIVIDAGNDHSDDLCSRYGFVRYFRQATKGLTAARNEALQHVTGDYVGMLDSDDFYESQFLEICADLLDQGADVAYSQGYRLVGAERSPLLVNHKRPQNLLAALVRDNFVIASFALQRRDALARIGGYRLGLPLADDYDLYLRLALSGCKFEHAPRPLGNRRHHDGSLTVSNPEANIWAIRDIVAHNQVDLCRHLGWSYARLMTHAELRLGMHYFENEDFRRAAKHFREALAGNPLSLRAWLFCIACLGGTYSLRAVAGLRRLKQAIEAPLRKVGFLESRW